MSSRGSKREFYDDGDRPGRFDEDSLDDHVGQKKRRRQRRDLDQKKRRQNKWDDFDDGFVESEEEFDEYDSEDGEW